jgi:hypothetical protein
MTSETRHLSPASTSSADALIWWATLSDDDRDLLRVTHSLLPNEPYLLALLATTGCPLVLATGSDEQRYTLRRPDQLHALLSQF